tara:strand:+ start:264 stop:482 length:219 start_codon:yes stop_codon:yes gene_type:complete
MRNMSEDERYEARMEAKREYAEEEPRHVYKYNCGGPRAYDGPCGAPDCGYCRNGPPPWEDEDEDEDEDEEGS